MDLSSLYYNLLSAISDFGGSPYIMAIIAITFVLYLLKKKTYYAIYMVLASLGSYPYGLILKGIFKLPRPEGAIVTLYFPADVYGFPSTHTVFYMAFWGCIIYLSFRLTHNDKYLMHVLRFLASFLILSIGISRVYLGVHSISDVVGGYIFGGVYLLLIILVDLIRSKRLKSLE